MGREVWTVSLSQFHFHTFTHSHFHIFTFSHIHTFTDVNGKRAVDRRDVKADTLAARFHICQHFSSPDFVFARRLFPTVVLAAPHVTHAVVLLSLDLAVGSVTLYFLLSPG